MPGAFAANLHEGSRSEILADYLFSTWGTVTPCACRTIMELICIVLCRTESVTEPSSATILWSRLRVPPTLGLLVTKRPLSGWSNIPLPCFSPVSTRRTQFFVSTTSPQDSTFVPWASCRIDWCSSRDRKLTENSLSGKTERNFPFRLL